MIYRVDDWLRNRVTSDRITVVRERMFRSVLACRFDRGSCTLTVLTQYRSLQAVVTTKLVVFHQGLVDMRSNDG